MSGNGTLYVLYELNQRSKLAVVDTSNGRIQRHIDLFGHDTVAYGRISALKNRLVFVPWKKESIHAHIYDNEKFIKAVHIDGAGYPSSVFFIATPDYLMITKRNQITLKDIRDMFLLA